MLFIFKDLLYFIYTTVQESFNQKAFAYGYLTNKPHMSHIFREKTNNEDKTYAILYYKY